MRPVVLSIAGLDPSGGAGIVDGPHDVGIGGIRAHRGVSVAGHVGPQHGDPAIRPAAQLPQEHKPRLVIAVILPGHLDPRA